MAKIEYKSTLVKAIQESDIKTVKMILDTYGYDKPNELLHYLHEGDKEMLKYLIEYGARIPDFEVSDGYHTKTLSMDLVNKLLVTLIMDEEKVSFQKEIKHHLRLHWSDCDFINANSTELVNISDNTFESISENHIKELTIGKSSSLPLRLNNITSSTIFTFNVFGNSPLEVHTNNKGIETGKYTIEYEKEFKSVFNSNLTRLDVELKNPKCDEVYLFEVKFLEWISNQKGPLTENYLNRKFYNDSIIADSVIAYLNQIIDFNSEKVDIKGLKKYSSIYKNLDVIQIVKHTLAILNNIPRYIEDGYKKITLYLLFWNAKVVSDETNNLNEMINKKYLKLVDDFNDFKFGFLDQFNTLFNEQGIDFDLQMITFTDFIEVLEMAQNQEEFLKKYYI